VNTTESLASFRLSDGRQLAYAEVGDKQGKPVLLLTGTGTGRSQAYWFDAAARQAGVRLIVTDRPGYGHSDPRADLSFLNHVDDVRELLDHLGLSRVRVAGMSGGGGYALACAYRLGDRIEQALMVCGMVPAPPEVLKQQGASVRLIFWLSRHMPRLTTSLMERARRRSAGAPPPSALARMPKPDRLLIERSDMQELAYGAPSRDSLRQGMGIFVYEVGLYSRPLGFELSRIRTPVRIWHGAQDANVPLAIARYVAAQVPGAQLHIDPEAAHLFALGNPAGMMTQVLAP